MSARSLHWSGSIRLVKSSKDMPHSEAISDRTSAMLLVKTAVLLAAPEMLNAFGATGAVEVRLVV